MQRSLWMRRFAAVAVLALTVAACGGGDDPAEEETTAEETETEEETEEETETEEAIDRPERDDVLDLAYVLPETGDLAFLGAPQIESVRLAVEDINEAGGVLGSDVTLSENDEAGDAARVREAAASAINGGADAIIGAAASGMSQEIIQLTFDNEIAQCSASNTSPSFSDQENNEFYYRTVPPDQAVSPIIAEAVVNEGYSNVAVVARADDYGDALRGLVVDALEGSGASVAVDTTYNPDESDFSSVVNEVTGANADSVVIIGFGEASTLIRQLIEEGQDPASLFGGDGLFGPVLAEQVNESEPGFIEGMKVIGASGGSDYNDRLNEVLSEEDQGNVIYGGQAYDCVVTTALASVAADSADPVEFREEISNVTAEGTECSDFEECAGLLEDGEDIDYQGASGPLEIEGTDPTFGRYAIAEFQADGTLEVTGDQDVDLADVE